LRGGVLFLAAVLVPVAAGGFLLVAGLAPDAADAFFVADFRLGAAFEVAERAVDRFAFSPPMGSAFATAFTAPLAASPMVSATVPATSPTPPATLPMVPVTALTGFVFLAIVLSSSRPCAGV
jgi:hypothetical protein